MFKVNNRNTRRRCEIWSKLTIKTPERRYFTPCSSVFIVNFKQEIPGGRMLMVSKVQGEFHYFFVLTVKKGYEITVRIKIILYLVG